MKPRRSRSFVEADQSAFDDVGEIAVFATPGRDLGRIRGGNHESEAGDEGVLGHLIEGARGRGEGKAAAMKAALFITHRDHLAHLSCGAMHVRFGPFMRGYLK